MNHLQVDTDSVKPETSFTEDLGADSLDLIELIMAFEEEFDVEIPDQDAEKMKTVGEIVTYLEKKINA